MTRFTLIGFFTAKLFIVLLFTVLSPFTMAKGKILATPGVSQVEGSAGGGLVPWAQLAGYAESGEVAVSGFCTQASVDDFRLNTCGIQGNWSDRIEISFAQQNFDVEPLSLQLTQNIVGLKARLYGDLIYSKYPQLSLGLQHKMLDTADVALSLGAQKKSGTDIYLAASKLHLGAVFGYNLLWNATARYTESNEMGLLGFQGPNDSGGLMAEASVAVLFNKHLAVGVEYRQKPDNLNLQENDWKDVFVAWFPNKHVSVTAAYIDLGTIAGLPDQDGFYLSLTGYY